MLKNASPFQFYSAGEKRLGIDDFEETAGRRGKGSTQPLPSPIFLQFKLVRPPPTAVFQLKKSPHSALSEMACVPVIFCEGGFSLSSISLFLFLCIPLN